MKLNYGDRVIITEKPGQLTLVCFLGNYHDIINQAWSEKKKPKGKEERLKVLAAAAAIIREDIQSVAIDNSHYPPPGRMF